MAWTSRRRGRPAGAHGATRSLEDFEDIAQVGELLTGGRGGAADEVEDPAVLHAIVGEPFDPAVPIEIDGDHALIDDPLWHECRLLGALRNIIKYLAAHGCDGRGCAESDQHLLLGGAKRDLLERSLGKDVAALKSLGEGAAPAEQQPERDERRNCARRPGVPTATLFEAHHAMSRPTRPQDPLNYSARRGFAMRGRRGHGPNGGQ